MANVVREPTISGGSRQRRVDGASAVGAGQGVGAVTESRSAVEVVDDQHPGAIELLAPWAPHAAPAEGAWRHHSTGQRQQVSNVTVR